MAWSQVCALCSADLEGRELHPSQTIKGHRPGSNKETTIVVLVCNTCLAYLINRHAEVWKERI